MFGQGSVDVTRAVAVLDSVAKTVLKLLSHLLDIRSCLVLAASYELGLAIAVVLALICEDVDYGRASVELDFDLLLLFVLTKEDLTGVLQATVRLERHMSNRVTMNLGFLHICLLSLVLLI